MQYKLKKKQQYLFATDLDGTFLSDHQSLHIKSYEAVKKIKEAGHKFVITTGRSWWWAKTIYDQLEITDASIHFSGAQIHLNGDDNFKEFHRYITMQEVKELVKQIDHNHIKNVITNGRKLQAEFTQPFEIDDLFFDVYELAIVLNCNFKKNHYEEMIKKYKNQFVIRLWSFGEETKRVLSISPVNTNKAHALKYVANHYGIPQENIIYFGDNVNDIEALVWSGHSYAPMNSIKEAKDSANEILKLTNNEGAVAKEIIRLLEEV